MKDMKEFKMSLYDANKFNYDQKSCMGDNELTFCASNNELSLYKGNPSKDNFVSSVDGHFNGISTNGKESLLSFEIVDEKQFDSFSNNVYDILSGA